MNKIHENKTLAEKKEKFAAMKVEWENLKKQEKELKEKFYNAPFAEKGKNKARIDISPKNYF